MPAALLVCSIAYLSVMPVVTVCNVETSMALTGSEGAGMVDLLFQASIFITVRTPQLLGDKDKHTSHTCTDDGSSP